jgi:hypothetical protein
MDVKFERMWKEATVVRFNVVSRNMPGETEGNDGKPQLGQLASEPRSEPGNSQVRSRSHASRPWGSIDSSSRLSIALYYGNEKYLFLFIIKAVIRYYRCCCCCYYYYYYYYYYYVTVILWVFFEDMNCAWNVSHPWSIWDDIHYFLIIV